VIAGQLGRRGRKRAPEYGLSPVSGGVVGRSEKNSGVDNISNRDGPGPVPNWAEEKCRRSSRPRRLGIFGRGRLVERKEIPGGYEKEMRRDRGGAEKKCSCNTC